MESVKKEIKKAIASEEIFYATYGRIEEFILAAQLMRVSFEYEEDEELWGLLIWNDELCASILIYRLAKNNIVKFERAIFLPTFNPATAGVTGLSFRVMGNG